MDLTLATLVVGSSAAERETAIAATLDPERATAVIAEGLPGSSCILHDAALQHCSLSVARIAPGCVCCNGNLVMRVTLNRMLQRKPSRLFISLATDTHLPQVRHFLSQEPYDKLLSLTKELIVSSRSQ